MKTRLERTHLPRFGLGFVALGLALLLTGCASRVRFPSVTAGDGVWNALPAGRTWSLPCHGAAP